MQNRQGRVRMTPTSTPRCDGLRPRVRPALEREAVGVRERPLQRQERRPRRRRAGDPGLVQIGRAADGGVLVELWCELEEGIRRGRLRMEQNVARR